jgi:general secretion pathway protein L
MTVTSEIKHTFDAWIAAVAGAVDAAAGRLVRSRRILLDVSADRTFTAKLISAKKDKAMPEWVFHIDSGRPQPPGSAAWIAAFRGSRVEAQLPSDTIMTCLLDFPSKAIDFLDGMIRAQVDRLTPWGPEDAIFGWSPSARSQQDRVEVAFAATSKLTVQPLIRLADSLRAGSITICAASADAHPAPRIKLFEQTLRSPFGATTRMPWLLRAGLVSVGGAAAAALLIAFYAGLSLQSEQADLQRQISQRRAALRRGHDSADSALDLLAKRKQTTPSSVMVLEAVSRALPDTTYVTELRIEGDKVQVVGVTQDAPSLIRLMEQSPQFTRATFFAPTTRAANETGERFHIEAHISAYFGSGS